MKKEQLKKLETVSSYVRRFAKDITDTVAGYIEFATAKGVDVEQVTDKDALEYFRGKLAIMKDYVSNALDMVESQQELDKAKSDKAKQDNQNMENKMTVKEKIDAAVSSALSAFYAKLNEFGIPFDDTDLGAYVDDPETKKTYCFNPTLIECDN